MSEFFFQAGGPNRYEDSNSLRFRGGQKLTRGAVGGDSSRQWTMSVWLKRGLMVNDDDGDPNGYFYGASSYTNLCQGMGFDDTSYKGSFGINFNIGINGEGFNTAGATGAGLGRRFRDFGGWYHFVMRWDGTGNNNAIRAWANNREIPWTQTKSGWYDMINRRSVEKMIGCTYGGSYNSYFSGFLWEFHMVDNQVLDPTTFGEYADNGVWIPKAPGKMVSDYGTDGWYLDFSDPSNLGADRSGKGNNWSPSGFDTSAGNSFDSDIADDNPFINMALPNAGAKDGYGIRYWSANERVYKSSGSAGFDWYKTSIPFQTDDANYYCEYTFFDSVPDTFSLLNVEYNTRFFNPGGSPGSTSSPDFGVSLSKNGDINYWGSYLGNYGAIGGNDTVAMSVKNGALQFYKNNNTHGPWIDVSGRMMAFGGTTIYSGTGSTATNFGNRPWIYPSRGDTYQKLSSATIPPAEIPSPGEYFKAVNYSGSNSSQTITLGFQPDFIIMKKLNGGSRQYRCWDSLRGNSKYFALDSSAGETTHSDFVTSVSSTGFTLAGNAADTNQSGGDYICYAWKKAPGVMDVIQYTGNGTSQSIAHNLGVEPAFIWVKERYGNGSWVIYNKGWGATKYANQNTNGGVVTSSSAWNNTAPTAGHVQVGSLNDVNTNGNTHLMYVFAEMPGFSHAGVYAGTAQTNGVFVDCGFQPAMVWIMNEGGSYNRFFKDTARKPLQPDDSLLLGNTNDDCTYNTSSDNLTITSTGFKVGSVGSGTNQSGGTMAYWAVAEFPLGSNVYPPTAR